MLKKILNRICGTGSKEPVPEEAYIIQRKIITPMNPISQERLEWLRGRKRVLEPMINTLKLYVNSGSAGVNNTQITAALATAQTEMLLIHTESQVLEDFFTKHSAKTESLLTRT